MRVFTTPHARARREGLPTLSHGEPWSFMCDRVCLPAGDTHHVVGVDRDRLAVGMDVAVRIPVPEDTAERTERDDEEKLLHDIDLFADIDRHMSFWERIEIVDGCWNWVGARNENGYGVLTVNKKRWRAHRYAYYLHYGSLSDDAIICHTCDNPACCKPEHLFAGTHSDNVADKVSKGRGRVPVGEAQNFAKLTEVDVYMLQVNTAMQT